MQERLARDILDAVRAMLEREDRVVLAVSGGVDSMVLLDAAARVRLPACTLVVATVDHGTGPAATEAAALVCREASRRGLSVRAERLSLPSASEAEWRSARWRWLRVVAVHERAVVATAHTRDDQVETVVMRLLRGAGARGLAGLYAESPVRRPLLDVSRRQIEAYANSANLSFVTDPSNSDRRFLRNRVRLDLLPAMRETRPTIEQELLDLSRRAADVRRDMEAVAHGFVRGSPRPGAADYDAATLSTLPESVLVELWPALAAAAGLALDRRGTLRLSKFTSAARSGDRVQVSGGTEVIRGRDSFSLRPVPPAPPATALPLATARVFGRFRFRVMPGASIKDVDGDPWFAALPKAAEVLVRVWRPGDRMVLGAGLARRVKRFFADAGIPGPLREGWPVVLVNGAIVWIPGIRRAPLSYDLSRRTSTLYHCEPYRR